MPSAPVIAASADAVVGGSFVVAGGTVGAMVLPPGSRATKEKSSKETLYRTLTT